MLPLDLVATMAPFLPTVSISFEVEIEVMESLVSEQINDAGHVLSPISVPKLKARFLPSDPLSVESETESGTVPMETLNEMDLLFREA